MRLTAAAPGTVQILRESLASETSEYLLPGPVTGIISLNLPVRVSEEIRGGRKNKECWKDCTGRCGIARNGSGHSDGGTHAAVAAIHLWRFLKGNNARHSGALATDSWS